MGWVYQWSTKSYDFSTETPIPFPVPMKDMCRAVVASVPWAEVFTADEEEPDWQAWEKDYGKLDGLCGCQLTLPRAGYRYCQLLSAKGHAHGARRPVRVGF